MSCKEKRDLNNKSHITKLHHHIVTLDACSAMVIQDGGEIELWLSYSLVCVNVLKILDLFSELLQDTLLPPKFQHNREELPREGSHSCM